MSSVHALATITSKGEISLPRPIRQALGVDAGSKVAFDLRDGQVVVTCADPEHEDPAIGAFLGPLVQAFRGAFPAMRLELSSTAPIEPFRDRRNGASR